LLGRNFQRIIVIITDAMQMSDRRSPSKIPLPRSLLERYSVRGGGGGGGGGRGRKEFRGQRREDEEEKEVVLCPLSVNELVSMSHALLLKPGNVFCAVL
jgi:hypothetical protein